MTPHCKGCVWHWNAGHPPGSPHIKYNDMCSKTGRPAKKSIGECKLKNLRREKDEITD